MTDKEIALGLFDSYFAKKPYAKFESFISVLKRPENESLIESIEKGLSTMLEALADDYSEQMDYYLSKKPEEIKAAWMKGNSDLLKWWGVTKLIKYVDLYTEHKEMTDDQIRKGYDALVESWLKWYKTYNNEFSVETFLKAFVTSNISTAIAQKGRDMKLVASWIPGANYKVIVRNGELSPTKVFYDGDTYVRTAPDNEDIKKDKMTGKIIAIRNSGIPEDLREVPPSSLPDYWDLSAEGTRYIKPLETESLTGTTNQGNAQPDSSMDSKESRIVSRDMREKPEDKTNQNLLRQALTTYIESKPFSDDEKNFLEDALNNELNGSPETFKTIAESNKIDYTKAMNIWGRNGGVSGFKGFVNKKLKDIKANLAKEDADSNEDSVLDAENEDAFGEMMGGSFVDNMKKEGFYDFED